MSDDSVTNITLAPLVDRAALYQQNATDDLTLPACVQEVTKYMNICSHFESSLNIVQACNLNDKETVRDVEVENDSDVGQDIDSDPVDGRIVMSSDTVGAPNVCFSVRSNFLFKSIL